jgi:hypothetical protein
VSRITLRRLQTNAYILTSDRGSCVLPQFRVTVKSGVGGTFVPKTVGRE